jgi:uncharacterized protein YqeY
MTVLDHIRADAITARKARAAAAGVLVALLGEIETKTKFFSPARSITDAEVLAIVKRFLDGAAETEATLVKMPDNERKTEALAKVATERAALIGYMPSQMGEGDIEAFAQAKKAEGMAEWMQWSAPKRPIRHTVTVEQDTETGDLIIPLPDDILLAAGLATGDEIEFEIDNERIIIRRAAAAPATT